MPRKKPVESGLSLNQRSRILFAARRDEASPNDIQALLADFCRRVEYEDKVAMGECSRDVVEVKGPNGAVHKIRRNEPITTDELRFLARAFRSFLNGKEALERALRLSQKPGRPPKAESDDIAIAREVLRYHLAGASLTDAAEIVSEACYDGPDARQGTTQIRKAWAAHKHDALIALRLERPQNAYPWTPAEIKRLRKIYRNVPSVKIAPE